MKDIFIDNNVARHFSPPLSQDYKELISWLYKEGALVVSQKLLTEYIQGLANIDPVKKNESILGVIGKLTQEGRLNKVKPEQIKAFVLKKHIENKLGCNKKDVVHLKTILISFRKMAITADKKFLSDINNHPKVDKIKPSASSSPKGIVYK